MKTLIENGTNISKYLFDDDTPVNITDAQTEVGDPANLDYIVLDMNSSNATMIEGVTEPVDAEGNGIWVGCKYLCSADGAWTENTDWVDPSSEG